MFIEFFLIYKADNWKHIEFAKSYHCNLFDITTSKIIKVITKFGDKVKILYVINPSLWKNRHIS